ncbi:MAG: thiamine diphosphokinase [candidate division Zixibacteria bacterium]|nr:thiamine diphosphokinase [candidate division Zixibacteria bacterium]
MKGFTLFLNGVYRQQDMSFYRQFCNSKCTVAVDGGYSFFRKASLFPDILIGDFDSLKRFPRDLPETTTVIRHPSRKDKTDLHLAIDYCVEIGARTIDIVQPSVGEIDHLLANTHCVSYGVFDSGSRKAPLIRIISPMHEIRPVVDGAVTFTDKVGDTVSVLALSEKVVLSITGTEYRGRGISLKLGETRGLRNRITSRRARFQVQGRALIVRLFSRRWDLMN